MAGRLPATSATRMLPSLLAVIAIDLGVSIVTIGSFLAVARLAGLAAPLAGWLVERSSPLQVLVASLGGFFLAAIALATAPTIWIFGPALVGLAVVSIGYEASATAWISSVAPTNSRTRFLARLDLAWSLGLLIGVPIATTLAGVSWRLAYCATGILAVAVLLRLRRGGELIVAKNVVPSSVAHGTSWVAIARSSWATFAAFGFLSGAAQLVVVVFGVWLSDEFSFAVASIG
ncbi:MAG: MFS transporter, partial [Acidimicrobiales bacterium]